jgi:hypothetical protein
MEVGHRVTAAVSQDSGDGGGQRAQRADRDVPVRVLVRAENSVRVMVMARDEPVDLAEQRVGWLCSDAVGL